MLEEGHNSSQLEEAFYEHLSPWQYSLLGDDTAPPPVTDNRRWMFKLAGQASVHRYAECAQHVFLQHSIFNSAFVQYQGRWRRKIGMVPRAPIVKVDKLPHPMNEAEIYAHASRMARVLETSMDIAAPQLAHMVFFDGGGDEPVFALLVINHLVFDLLSIYIVMEEIERAVRGTGLGHLKSRGGFDIWTKDIEHYRIDRFPADRNYWEALPWDEVRRLELPSGNHQHNGSWSTTLSPDIGLPYQQVAKVAAEAGFHPIDIVIATIALITWQSQGDGYVSVALMENGRFPFKFLRSIGLFTYWWPLLIKGSKNLGAVSLLRLIKDQKAIPVPNFGYMLGRYGSEDEQVRAAFRRIEKPQIHLNFTAGLGTGGRKLDGRAIGTEEFLDLAMMKDIVLFVFSHDDMLRFKWDYSGVVYGHEEMDRLSLRFAETFRQIVDDLREHISPLT